MIDTLHLLPPDLGPRSNPTLFGVAQAIAELFPPVMLSPQAPEQPVPDARVCETVQAPAEAVGLPHA